jgi:hypothetical protein
VFLALWIFFGFTALVICGLIFLIGRPGANKDNRPPLKKP